MTKLSPARFYGFSALALAVVSFCALRFGAVSSLPWSEALELRLPRLVMGCAEGIGLAVAGATLQALFANPLCEPYTLGISSGSALGAVIGIALGLELNFAGLAGSAFAGALLFAAVLQLISLRPGATALTLLLAGVMLGFLGSSLVALWMALADPSGIHGAVLWLMGDLARARSSGAWSALVAALILSFLIWSRWRDLDALLTGEEGALSLGVPVPAIRRRAILLVSLLVGVCVSGAGMIGFVGLVVPHFIRFRTGSLHRDLLPLSAIWGASALVAADVVGRILARPYELPVGVVTSLLGAPLLLWIMLRRPQESAG